MNYLLPLLLILAEGSSPASILEKPPTVFVLDTDAQNPIRDIYSSNSSSSSTIRIHANSSYADSSSYPTSQIIYTANNTVNLLSLDLKAVSEETTTNLQTFEPTPISTTITSTISTTTTISKTTTSSNQQLTSETTTVAKPTATNILTTTTTGSFTYVLVNLQQYYQIKDKTSLLLSRIFLH